MPSPVWAIGTYDAAGAPNLMTVAWGGICCSKPPAVSISLREATYTYAGLVEHRAFTVNIPSARHVGAADLVGVIPGRDGDKFKAAGLTAVASDLVDAPYVKEFPLVLECRLVQSLKLGLHTLFVGEVVDVKADEEVLGSDGYPSVEGVRPFTFVVAEESYYALGDRIGPASAAKKGATPAPIVS
jgi:flavin reductase (DIM6/NTAB) family NADH-FMN oxidoreductase RutF